ncbi:MAG: NADH-quinone oxidoreductase subunit I [bacterium]|nr:NADH-quinone oxidoreductase subunit I [bacterium]
MFELVRGLCITFFHLWTKAVTIQYPTQRREPPDRFRGSHRFVLNEENLEDCVACCLCARYCPSNAIKITASSDEKYQKRVLTYELDIKRCIFCGFCVEACPKDALKMSKDYELATFSPNLLYSKETLLSGPEIIRFK